MYHRCDIFITIIYSKGNGESVKNFEETIKSLLTF